MPCFSCNGEITTTACQPRRENVSIKRGPFKGRGHLELAVIVSIQIDICQEIVCGNLEQMKRTIIDKLKDSYL